MKEVSQKLQGREKGSTKAYLEMWHTGLKQSHKTNFCHVSNVSFLRKVTAFGLLAQREPGFPHQAQTWPLRVQSPGSPMPASPYTQVMGRTHAASAHLKYLPLRGSKPSARAQCRLVWAPSLAVLRKGEKSCQSRHSRKECRTSSERTMPGCTA